MQKTITLSELSKYMPSSMILGREHVRALYCKTQLMNSDFRKGLKIKD